MISFTEYLRHYHQKQLPKIQGDIMSTSHLNESVELAGNYEDYAGPEAGHPLNNGYVREYGPVYSHPNHPGKFFHFGGSSHPKEFNSYDDAVGDSLEIRYRRQDAVNDHAHELKKHYLDSAYKMHHKDAIAGYTMFDSRINEGLLNNSLRSQEQPVVDRLDDAMKIKKTPRPLIVYSGTNHAHAQLLRNHDEVLHPGFISTSIDPKRAMTFAASKEGDIMKIHLPAGHEGLYTGEMSSIPSEREFIIPRGMKLRVDHSKREIIGNDLHKKPIYIHHVYPVQE